MGTCYPPFRHRPATPVILFKKSCTVCSATPASKHWFFRLISWVVRPGWASTCLRRSFKVFWVTLFRSCWSMWEWYSGKILFGPVLHFSEWDFYFCSYFFIRLFFIPNQYTYCFILRYLRSFFGFFGPLVCVKRSARWEIGQSNTLLNGVLNDKHPLFVKDRQALVLA